MKDILSNENYRLWARLSQTRDIVYKARERELSQFGISPAEARALTVLSVMGVPLTAADLSRWLIREPNTLSSLLDRMGREGLIKKTRDSNNKKILKISLTQKGKRACTQVAKMKTIERIFSGIPDEQRQQLMSCLDIVMKNGLREIKWRGKVPFP